MPPVKDRSEFFELDQCDNTELNSIENLWETVKYKVTEKQTPSTETQRAAIKEV